MDQQFVISSEQQLADIIGEPHEFIAEKVKTSLDEPMLEYIQRSPLIFLSTLDANGQADVSPKGDAPGFVHIDNAGNLLIPDRPGNKLTFGFKNILNNGNVGLIFVVPTQRETLRIKGRATLSNDPALLEQLSAQGKPALLCTYIEVDECFFHCGKAMIRSRLWQPDRWQQYDDNLLALTFHPVLYSQELNLQLFQRLVIKTFLHLLFIWIWPVHGRLPRIRRIVRRG